MFASVLGPSSSRSAAQESGQPKALQASPVHIPSTGPEQQLPLPLHRLDLKQRAVSLFSRRRVHPSRFQVR
ncbi:hypothetical protein F9C07_10427 [Aspergillus flavus]|uniref:Uncharacterized protein n=1 Tax=Aspergillus flavus (strain ATCC 200026 / FGSC A1120 / IAM 13836 / NRRL 3357 / JCM 12722 / SRRC 167) TaxID=332952 RepID=A0A7U2R0A9_ASPFN|nr:hypothetical protein F9C07_10427 [Aspergillus flavus]